MRLLISASLAVTSSARLFCRPPGALFEHCAHFKKYSFDLRLASKTRHKSDAAVRLEQAPQTRIDLQSLTHRKSAQSQPPSDIFLTQVAQGMRRRNTISRSLAWGGSGVLTKTSLRIAIMKNAASPGWKHLPSTILLQLLVPC